MSFPRLASAVLATALVSIQASPAGAQAAATGPIAANDNRQSAGTVADGVLTVNLVAGRGEWRPEAGDGPVLDVAAFGEAAGTLTTPGPLIRTVEGTEMVIRVHNTLPDEIAIHGFVPRPSAEDTVWRVAAGKTRELRFTAGAPGTYHYWATTSAARPALPVRTAFDSQLGGALIVDASAVTAADRVFVMTEWDDSRTRIDELVTPDVRRVFAINGRSWPHTERLDEHVGERVRWRVVNLTQAGHPMHLHGFYFDVQGIGTGLRQIAYQAADVRKVVTENMPIGGTMEMAWTPERPGNWLLHCHLIAHVTPALRFWMAEVPDGSAHGGHGAHDPASAMAGLVMGIRVTGDATKTAGVPAALQPARQLTVAMRKKPGYWQPEDAFGFALISGEGADPSAGPTVPGPLLVLRRGEPVEITVKNELPDETAVHWHGIELDSQYDGVPGWSGSAGSTTPAIPPGGSFRVRFTPPRAGTFMYHTHAHDLRQLASGLYGAIVVLEPDETFDPARDHVVLLGMEGAKDTLKYERFPVVVNGSRHAALTFKAGTPNRLRLINITTNFGGLNVSVIGGNRPVNWQWVAKDGADLPESQRRTQPALNQAVGVGETYDFLVDPPPAGQLWIDVRRASGEFVQQVPVRIARD